MHHTTSLLQNLAQRDAHRLAQKVSVLAMASLVLLCQWSSKLIAIATPDEAMVTLLVGVLAYVIAHRTVRSLVAADRYFEEELTLMFAIDEQHPADARSLGNCG